MKEVGSALGTVDSKLKTTETELRQVQAQLKFDPSNTELLAQKHRLLGDAVKETKEKTSPAEVKSSSIQKQDLQNLDISIVKIDKTITQNSVTDTGFIILKNIIRTAQDIGFKTLCEGVETKEQEEAAIKAGCDFLQGYFYYRPMPVARLEKVFNEASGGV